MPPSMYATPDSTWLNRTVYYNLGEMIGHFSGSVKLIIGNFYRSDFDFKKGYYLVKVHHIIEFLEDEENFGERTKVMQFSINRTADFIKRNFAKDSNVNVML